MRCLHSIFAGFLLAAALTAPSHAQDRAWIEVESNIPGAYVYVDTARVGSTVSGVFAVPPGVRRVRLAAPVESAWSVVPVDTVVNAQPGDTTHLTLLFPYHYRIESVPYGATVYLVRSDARERLGVTPLTYTSDDPVEDHFSIEKPGFLARPVEAGSDLWNRHAVLLDRADRADDGLSSAEVPWNPPRRFKSRWIDYGAVGLAVASAALSVHYKFKADALYDRYEETGDPSLRARIDALDTRAAVALGSMQVGLGIFAIRLALR